MYHTGDMKRAIEDTEKDFRNQLIAETLFQYDDTAPLVVPELILSFRNHPWRLLRLMAVSRMAYQRIESVIKDNFPTFWYNVCLAQFPDVVIMIDVMTHTHRDSTHYIYTEPYTNDVNDIIHCVDTPNDEFDYQNRGFAYDRIDDSFVTDDILGRCWRDEEEARRLAHCFCLIYPIGIPPAAYCFASQIQLSQLTLEYFDLIRMSPDHHLMSYDMINKYTVFNFTILSSAYLYPQQDATLNDLEKATRAHYTFNDLLRMIRKTRDGTGNEAKLLDFKRRVFFASLMYALTPDVSKNPFETDEEFERYLKERAEMREKYQSQDPRYMSMLKMTAIDWKTVVEGQIKWLQLYGEEKKQFLDIQCSACGKRGQLFMEAMAPHDIYCSATCQTLKY